MLLSASRVDWKNEDGSSNFVIVNLLQSTKYLLFPKPKTTQSSRTPLTLLVRQPSLLHLRQRRKPPKQIPKIYARIVEVNREDILL